MLCIGMVLFLPESGFRWPRWRRPRSQYFDTSPLFLCAADKMRLHAAVKLLLCMAAERQRSGNSPDVRNLNNHSLGRTSPCKTETAYDPLQERICWLTADLFFALGLQRSRIVCEIGIPDLFFPWHGKDGFFVTLVSVHDRRAAAKILPLPCVAVDYCYCLY